MRTFYTLRVFSNITDKCLADFESPVIPHVGESFYLDGDETLYRINDVMYCNLDNLEMIDLIVSEDRSYDHLYEEEER